MKSAEKGLLLLYDRPTEPIFMAKGETQILFDVPYNYLTDRYKPLALQLASRFAKDTEEKIEVKEVPLPDISFPLELDRSDNFSVFIPKHQKMAGKLVEIFLNAKDAEELMSIAVFCRDRLNPYLFNYALSVAIMYREDTKGLTIPNFFQSFPIKFLDKVTYEKAYKEASIMPKGLRTTINIPADHTGNNLDHEHRVAYFREDIGINLHHWHWHLVYPVSYVPLELIKKDRRGELFYYMHHQILARYNFERFSNNLAKVKGLSDLTKPIQEGYFSKLDVSIASQVWPPRPPNARLKDIDRPDISVKIADLNMWRNNVTSSITRKYVLQADGKMLKLEGNKAIDIIGDLVEASDLSLNKGFFGNLHNMGHVAIALCHDPENTHLEDMSVMGDTSIAMRDPIFYRWHQTIDDIFETHKTTLTPYTSDELIMKDLTNVHITIQSNAENPNMIKTFWKRSEVNLSRGLDFAPRGSVPVSFTHLQHEPFKYSITFSNRSSAQYATFRIFLAPVYNERGIRMSINEQRLLMVELDKFKGMINQSLVLRDSKDSSVTIPFDRTFRDLDAGRPTDSGKLESFNFCGCGWPHHMLIPKGNIQGMECTLFVMISNYEEGQDLSGECNDAYSYCGLSNKVYPDKQPMGYPFDRKINVPTLKEFLTPNMAIAPITIKFTNKIVT